MGIRSGSLTQQCTHNRVHLNSCDQNSHYSRRVCMESYSVFFIIDRQNFHRRRYRTSTIRQFCPPLEVKLLRLLLSKIRTHILQQDCRRDLNELYNVRSVNKPCAAPVDPCQPLSEGLVFSSLRLQVYCQHTQL